MASPVVTGIAFDWIENRVYWTDTSSIVSVKTDGSSRRIISLHMAISPDLVLDPCRQ